MSTAAVLGLQWGDEGKGKIVTRLAPDYRYVVRFQGGGNAGHTVYVNGQKLVLHHLPSGVLCENTISMLMPGMVLDPNTFFKEIETVESAGISVEGRLKVSGRVQITTEYHRTLDQLREAAAGTGKIGTTGRGIGTTYADKAQRLGVRAIDLTSKDALRHQLKRSLSIKNPMIEQLGGTAVDIDEMTEKLSVLGERLKPYLADTSLELAEALQRGDDVLFEGAQAAMLDIDIGTYPYVTSSCTTAGGISAGCGCNVGQVEKIIGIAKAYCTRVGAGPFPTEIEGEIGTRLREAGGEFGSTTGRPRRCGWFDAFAMRYVARLGAINALCITKLDVLAGLGDLKVGVGYEGWDQPGLPESDLVMSSLRPVYETLPGFDDDITGCPSFDDLPENARSFITRLEELVGVPVKYISTGPQTDQLIVL